MPRIITCVLFLALALPVSGQEAQRPTIVRTDIVFLLDVSSSMHGARAWTRARTLLTGILDRVVQPGMQIAIVPFGDGVHEAASFEVPADGKQVKKTLRKMRRFIANLEARDAFTHLYEAIDKGLGLLEEFQRKHPGHVRRILLVSDGHELSRREGPHYDLGEVITSNDREGFRKKDDWFIWYAHFGKADETLARTLERTGAGKVISLDDLPTMQWAVTRFEPGRVDVGRVRPGDWTRTVRVTARTDGVGRSVTFEADAGELPHGMTISVEPREVMLTAEEMPIELRISGTGARAGEFGQASIRVAAKGSELHWVETERIGIDFRVLRQRIDVGTALLDLGEVAAGGRVTRPITLIPGDDEPARLQFDLADVAEGTSLVVDPGTVEIRGRREVAVTLEVGEAAARGAHESVLRIGGDLVEVVPSQVRIRYRIALGRVVAGQDRVSFGALPPGGTALRSVTLVPNRAALGREIGVEVSGLPEGWTLEAPARVELSERTTVPLTLRVPEGAAAGAIQARLRLLTPTGIVAEPGALPVTIEVAALPKLLLPAVVDLGDVHASKARELAGHLEIAVPSHHAGARLELVSGGADALEPRVVTLEQGRMRVPVHLRSTVTEGGAHSSVFDAFVTRAGRRDAAGQITFRWRVNATFVAVRGWTPPATLAHDGTRTAGSLVIEASRDLAGKTLRLEAVVTGVSATLAQTEATLKGGMQTIPVTLEVDGPEAGRYDGTLRARLTEAVDGVDSLEPLTFSLEIATAPQAPAPPPPEVRVERVTERVTSPWPWVVAGAALLALVLALVVRARKKVQPAEEQVDLVIPEMEDEPDDSLVIPEMEDVEDDMVVIADLDDDRA